MSAEVISPAGAARGDLPVTCLTFGWRGATFAIEARAVREIVRLPELTPVEELYDHVVGVFDLRGVLVPVADLDRCFGKPPRPYSVADYVVVLDRDAGGAGIIVNDVFDVLAARRVPMAADAGKPLARRFLAGQVEIGERILMLLDPLSILPGGPGDETVEPAPAEEEPGLQDFFPEVSDADRELLRERARDLMNAPAAGDAGRRLGLAVVELGGERFAVPLKSVREFATLRRVVRVPCCPPHILGTMNLRGSLITVVDLNGPLHLPAGRMTDAADVLVVEHRGLRAAFPVTDVLDVLYVEPSSLQPLPLAVRAMSEQYFEAAVPYRGQLLAVLDVDGLLASDDLTVREDA